MNEYICVCRRCGKRIIFIQLPSGKKMPCDAKPVFYKALGHGGTILYNEGGEQVRCELTDDRENATSSAWRPHWASCTDAKDYRRAQKIKSGIGRIEKREQSSVKPPESPELPEFEQMCLFLKDSGFRHPE